MNIVGDKVILRAITMNDMELLLNMINDPETERMLGGSSFPVSAEGQQKWIKEQFERINALRTIVATKDNTKVGVGTIILSDIDYVNGTAQVHIKMDKESGRGKGYGTDALNTIVRYAFEELRLNCLYADILSYNEISQKLFRKAGFVKEGVLRSRVYKNGEHVDVFSYSKLRIEHNV